MDKKTEQAAQAARAIGRLKNKVDDKERLRIWRETCADQGLTGEFVLAAKLNGAGYTEEEAKMVAELFGR
ncbi:hypothetical protein ACG2K1_05750 [Neisseria sp. 23W00296]|uniref:hypothetical protein n=1 Tax=unclassified Neisseria TaxID=2623750 RepID=UPI00034632FD|nr:MULTISPECIES: hypothetical protein [unclassified Neisseria]